MKYTSLSLCLTWRELEVLRWQGRQHSAREQLSLTLHPLDQDKYFGARQRSGEGVMRRNGCPERCFWRVRFFSAPLRFALRTPQDLKAAEKKQTLQKHSFGQLFLHATPALSSATPTLSKGTQRGVIPAGSQCRKHHPAHPAKGCTLVQTLGQESAECPRANGLEGLPSPFGSSHHWRQKPPAER